jgi:DNA-binding beta-propeller fold protein YncE
VFHVLTRIAGILLLPALTCLMPRTGAAEPAPPLVLERTIPLASVSGRIDHMAVDIDRKRLFVAELGNGTVDVIDLSTGAAVHRIGGLREPQGVGFAPKADLLAIASAGDGSVRFFRGADFSPAGRIDLGDDADNVRLDAATGNLVVGYSSGGLAVIDPTSQSVVSRIKLAAHPEGFQLDGAGRRAFVNVPDARQIAVLDMPAGRQIATWRVPNVSANFPMALNDGGATVAVAFRDGSELVLLDTKSGAARNSLRICDDADDVFFDSRRHRLYVSCGEGAVDVIQESGTGYARLGRIKTKPGARTSLFVPQMDRLIVAARAGFFGLGSDATLMVFRPDD